ncbi:undecaprenyl diphosphate synthase family protein [Candidatus Woesearchaeota archaeon]|nr:undecaprenyl diphosphate synthase family protein [Candidatus Woesearchaeota archaeon]
MNKPTPMHLAITLDLDRLDLSFPRLIELINYQVQNAIPVLTVGFHKDTMNEKLAEFFKFYLNKSFLKENKIKVSFLGKWYDLPSVLVEEFKEILDLTKEFDAYFLNFVINYDGQREIVDACQILARQIVADKIDIENISESAIKENIYSSYFVPPDIIIKTGDQNKLDGFLLWDSKDSRIIFTNRSVSEMTIQEIENLF